MHTNIFFVIITFYNTIECHSALEIFTSIPPFFLRDKKILQKVEIMTSEYPCHPYLF